MPRAVGDHQAACVAALTVPVSFLGTVGVLYFDRDAPGTTDRTVGDALWWSAAMIATINKRSLR